MGSRRRRGERTFRHYTAAHGAGAGVPKMSKARRKGGPCMGNALAERRLLAVRRGGDGRESLFQAGEGHGRVLARADDQPLIVGDRLAVALQFDADVVEVRLTGDEWRRLEDAV